MSGEVCHVCEKLWKNIIFFEKINHFCKKWTRQSIFFHKMTHFSQISEFITYFSKNFLMFFSMLQWRCLTMLNSYRVTHWESTCALEWVPARAEKWEKWKFELANSPAKFHWQDSPREANLDGFWSNVYYWHIVYNLRIKIRP